ncbi:MAG: outer membrane beta-barrel protein [Gammaproteobacteria bacterium]|nr:outer membrane beta-barrel protein [Gammaproteobacteria bacterium]
MKAHIINRYFLTALILIFSSELFATAATDYEQGVAAYKAGDNASAVIYFESALKQGMVSISLKYNLASSYYKVGRYEEAKKYFKLLNKTLEMREIAEYHLGVIAVKEKDRSLAQRYFSSVVNSGKDEKLVKLSNKYLLALAGNEDRWKSRLSLNLGYDDNISSVSEDSVLDTADSFYELSASSNLLIKGRRKQGWLADVAVYGIKYSDIDENDQYVIALGVEKAMQFKGWDTGVHLSVADITYGGDDLQTIGKLNFRGRKKISKNEWINMRYQYEDIKSDQTIYDYLEGWRQRVSLEYQNLTKNNISQIQYEYELNNRGELITSIGTYDYSPTRHTVRGIYTHFINKKWWLTGDMSYRFSDFEASQTIDRDDDQWMFALTTDYRFDKTFKLTAKYQYTDNSSTLDVYSYDKSVIRVGISKMF